MRYFMSYSIMSADGAKTGFGSSTTESHPINEIDWWNKKYTDKVYVLLFYRELAPHEANLRTDRECMWFVR